MKDITLYTENKGLEGIEFSMGEHKKLLGIDSLIKMKQNISEYIAYVEHWTLRKEFKKETEFIGSPAPNRDLGRFFFKSDFELDGGYHFDDTEEDFTALLKIKKSFEKKDLIKVEELLPYQGLIYFDGEEFEVVKEATYLHKDKIDEKTKFRLMKTLSERDVFDGKSKITYELKKER